MVEGHPALQAQAHSLGMLGGTKLLSQTKRYFNPGLNTLTLTELMQNSLSPGRRHPRRRPDPRRRVTAQQRQRRPRPRPHCRRFSGSALPAPTGAYPASATRDPLKGDGVRDGLAHGQWPPAPQDGAAGVGSGSPAEAHGHGETVHGCSPHYYY